MPTKKEEESKKDDTSTQDDKNSDSSSKDNQNKSDNDNKNDETAIPKYRFDEVNDRAKKAEAELEKLKADAKKREEDELKSQNKYKELSEKQQQEIDNLKGQIQANSKRSAVRMEASKLGVREDALDDLVKLINLEEVNIDDSGQSNAKSILEPFLKNKTYLLSEEGKKNIGTSTSSDGGEPKTGKLYKWSEVQTKSKDFKWYEENKEDLERAKQEGRIDFNA